MKLQQIKLSGFKSFAENTVIEINGQLVGIVGPNGCGKSNVIDAVRWVLGESSAKQLRGDSMADIIFSGSLSRKSVSRASVELKFDNQQKSLHGLWNSYDEIAIKRLISRQGDSNYYINNQLVRRKDITELFLGTGVGTKGYAVIEQGMISRILESRPEEMRLFIEEAAGVSKYRERRKETLHRLSDTRENLQRLEDIHGEIIKQLANLEDEAKVAALYQELHHNLKESQLLITIIKVNEAENLLDEAKQIIQKSESELQLLTCQIEEINIDLANENNSKELKEQLLQKKIEEFNKERTSLARVEERFKHRTELLARFENESAKFILQESALKENIQELLDKDQLINKDIEGAVQKIDEAELIREELTILTDAHEEAHDKIAKLLSLKSSEISNIRYEKDLLQNNLKHKEQQKKNLTSRMERLVGETNTLDFDESYHSLKEEVTAIGKELTNIELLTEGKNQSLSSLAPILAESESRLASLQSETILCTARSEMLTKILASNEEAVNFAAQTNLMVSELWEHLKVDHGYEDVLEVALGNLFQAKILDSLDQLVEPPEKYFPVWLKSNEEVSVKAGTLSEKVYLTDSTLGGVYSYLNNYKIVDSVNESFNLNVGEYGLTLEGHLVSRNYICYYANSKTQHILKHRHELDLVNTSLKVLDTDLIDQERTASKLREQKELLNSELIGLKAKERGLFAKKHELQLKFASAEQIYLQSVRHQERNSAEIALLTQEINHLSHELEELEIQIEDKIFTLEDMISEHGKIEEQKTESEKVLQLNKNKISQVTSEINHLLINKQVLQERKQSLANAHNVKKDQLVIIKKQLDELSIECETLSNENTGDEINELQKSINEINFKMQTLQSEIDEISKKIIGLKNKAEPLNKKYRDNLEKINQTKFKVQEQQILLASYRENLAEIELSSDEISKMLSNNKLTLTELVSLCKNLEMKINDLGLVNLKSIDDLAKQAQHEKELTLQMDDLKEAVSTLSSAIEQIDVETRKILLLTFDKLNEAIMVYFQTLFGGGKASLALKDNDILVSGVEIFAEPPGKKNATIHLLSGGEKALSAMSFIFALFSLNPAPFCLLDEVDAPLDDANTERFCNLVRKLSDKTQFVYISHNRLAMEMADQLVGITMQEKGVSTVVTVNMHDHERDKDAI